MKNQIHNNALTTYRPASTGNLELAYSKEKKIREIGKSKPVLILEMINYLYVLLNVKPENKLNTMEESVLNGVILTSFSNFSIGEIKHAFRLALAGTFPVNIYNKLDSITLSNVLNAYKSYRDNKLKQPLNCSFKTELPTPNDLENIEKSFIESVVIPLWNEYEMNEQWMVDTSHWLVYDLLNKKDLVNISDDIKHECMKLAEREYKRQQKQKQMKSLMKIREAPTSKDAIINIAKSYALKQIFFEMKLAEIDLNKTFNLPKS